MIEKCKFIISCTHFVFQQNIIFILLYFYLFDSLSQHNNFILNKTGFPRILSLTEIFCLGFLFLWNRFDACFHWPSLSPPKMKCDMMKLLLSKILSDIISTVNILILTYSNLLSKSSLLFFFHLFIVFEKE